VSVRLQHVAQEFHLRRARLSGVHPFETSYYLSSSIGQVRAANFIRVLIVNSELSIRNAVFDALL
jgi:hypothetical protein